MYTQLLATLLLPSVVSAHFYINWPPSRSSDEDQMSTFPCGGGNSGPSSNRTLFPLSGGPLQLQMGHSQTNLQVLIGLGNNPGEAFNTVLVPTFMQAGLDNFCIGDVTFPASLGLREGDNATIQVVSNGDPAGGLYNCADITFTSQPLSAEQYSNNCQNSTGIQTSALPGAPNANQTTEEGESNGSPAPSSSSGSSPSQTGAAASASSSAFAAPMATMMAGAGWLLAGAVGVVGLGAL